MNYAEFMKKRGIPYPYPLGGDAPVEVGTVNANGTAPESAGAETPEADGGLSPSDGTFAGVEAETPDEEPLADTVGTSDTEPTGSRNRRRSTG